jgi:hypothetical protein
MSEASTKRLKWSMPRFFASRQSPIESQISNIKFAED